MKNEDLTPFFDSDLTPFLIRLFRRNCNNSKEVVMQTWEYKILYSWAKITRKGELNLDWNWEIEAQGKTLKGFTHITEYMNELGSQGWELIAAIPINWAGGETWAFQMFFKRPMSKRE